MTNTTLQYDASQWKERPLKFLQSHQIFLIDDALSQLGDYGEVRLVVVKKRFRFLVTQKSMDVQKWNNVLDENDR